MTDTANLALPCIEGSQAQKHVTHNEALRILDTLVQLAVLDRDLTAPPGSPSEGQRWIVKTGASGAWASHVNAIAAWQDGAWQFSAPSAGWLAYVIDESALLSWNGSAWVAVPGAGRDVLTANRIYYVRTDGSDSNNGLANTSGGAFLTIQKAIDIVAALDLATCNVTIQLADGTYTAGGVVPGLWTGTGNVTIKGNVATPTNVIVSTTSAAAFVCKNNGRLTLEALKLTTTSGGAPGLLAQYGALIVWTNLVFGVCAGAHVRSELGGICEASGNYTIAGNASQHIVCVLGGAVRTSGMTVTLSGTPAFTAAFVTTNACGVYTSTATWSGSASGALYNVSLNGVINTLGTGLPSGLSGTTVATGGQYV